MLLHAPVLQIAQLHMQLHAKVNTAVAVALKKARNKVCVGCRGLAGGAGLWKWALRKWKQGRVGQESANEGVGPRMGLGSCLLIDHGSFCSFWVTNFLHLLPPTRYQNTFACISHWAMHCRL